MTVRARRRDLTRRWSSNEASFARLATVNGDPFSRIEDIERLETMFKDGIGYDSRKLFASVKGQVGLH